MVIGARRQPQVGQSPLFANNPVLGANDGRKNKPQSLPSQREGPSNGMVHSIVDRFEKGEPLIAEDGRSLTTVASVSVVDGKRGQPLGLDMGMDVLQAQSFPNGLNNPCGVNVNGLGNFSMGASNG
ncbi:hypothetical protein Patl1_26543 [Pistacia atlantica]|uniref:Uncharacterized protein n=1 Tax=Pistacia atlantica TaxID=434234 RepID=A0ACC1B246_9ROSI|nr:hypothetical protein Patl1_26543 [Pistacia atlantica]